MLMILLKYLANVLIIQIIKVNAIILGFEQVYDVSPCITLLNELFENLFGHALKELLRCVCYLDLLLDDLLHYCEDP
jgi:hypothetical protein